jgi:tellurite resistance protein TerC
VRLSVREVEAHPDRNVVLRLMRRFVPMTRRFHGQRFVVRVDHRLLATPMLAVLVAVATTDVAFAADSVPAIFAVTDDPFLVFAANAFSVLGMLALYFLLAGMLGRFRLLRPALGAILVFVGGKMAISDLYHIPVALSLAVIVAILAAAAAASLMDERRAGFSPTTTRPSVSVPPPRIREDLVQRRRRVDGRAGRARLEPPSRDVRPRARTHTLPPWRSSRS